MGSLKYIVFGSTVRHLWSWPHTYTRWLCTHSVELMGGPRTNESQPSGTIGSCCTVKLNCRIFLEFLSVVFLNSWPGIARVLKNWAPPSGLIRRKQIYWACFFYLVFLSIFLSSQMILCLFRFFIGLIVLWQNCSSPFSPYYDIRRQKGGKEQERYI